MLQNLVRVHIVLGPSTVVLQALSFTRYYNVNAITVDRKERGFTHSWTKVIVNDT